VGQKVHPYGFRLGVIYPWKSNWYANRRDYIEALHEDVWIRKHIRSRLSRAGISSIDIERKGDQIWVYIRTARPGIVIGRKGAEVDRLRKDVERYTKKRVDVKVEDMNQASSEVRPDTDAALLAQGVAEQLGAVRVVPQLPRMRPHERLHDGVRLPPDQAVETTRHKLPSAHGGNDARAGGRDPVLPVFAPQILRSCRPWHASARRSALSFPTARSLTSTRAESAVCRSTTRRTSGTRWRDSASVRSRTRRHATARATGC
jgi:hypothetical protein